VRVEKEGLSCQGFCRKDGGDAGATSGLCVWARPLTRQRDHARLGAPWWAQPPLERAVMLSEERRWWPGRAWVKPFGGFVKVAYVRLSQYAMSVDRAIACTRRFRDAGGCACRGTGLQVRGVDRSAVHRARRLKILGKLVAYAFKR